MRNPLNCLVAAVLLFLAAACGSSTSPRAPDTVAAGPGHPAGVLHQRIALDMRPYGVAVTRRGIAVVSRLDASAVTRIDLATGAMNDIRVGQVPTGVAPLGENSVAVTNQGSESVSFVDVTTNVEAGTVAVPHTAFRVVASPSGATAYVSISEGRVAFVDVATRTVTRSVGVGSYPNGMVLAGNTLFVAANDGTLSFVDIGSGAVTRTLSFPAILQDVAIAPQRGELFVASESDSLIRIISSAAGTILGALAVPRESSATGVTFGLAVTPDGQQLYATSGRRLLIYDIATRTLLRTVVVEGWLRRIAFDPLGKTAVVSDESGGVLVIK